MSFQKRSQIGNSLDSAEEWVRDHDAEQQGEILAVGDDDEDDDNVRITPATRNAREEQRDREAAAFQPRHRRQANRSLQNRPLLIANSDRPGLPASSVVPLLDLSRFPQGAPRPARQGI